LAYLLAFPELPRFGEFHDAAIYMTTAKSLAEGNGYRIESLPGQPFQTKYPPLYPAFLSLAWAFGESFPGNLRIAGWLSWLTVPILLVLLHAQVVRWRFSLAQTWFIVALFAVNPYTIWLSTALLSELPFLAISLAGMYLIERATSSSTPIRWAIGAGLTVGLGYLTRTAGLAMLPAGFLFLWYRSSRRTASAFGAAMVPAIATWTVWSKLHLAVAPDAALAYYTDYLGYQTLNVKLADLPLVLWKNADGFLGGLGSLIIPKIVPSLFSKIAAQVIAVAMISGVVRLVRASRCELYAAFALFSAILMLIWHYPPDERFVVPLMPLAFAGLIAETHHLWGMLRVGRHHPDCSQRLAAISMQAGTTALFAAVLVYQAYVDLVYLPQDARSHRIQNAARLRAYDWIRANVPPKAAFYAHSDPLLYLYTNHRALSRPLLPRNWYHEDHAAIVGLLSNLNDFAHTYGLLYYYRTDGDLYRGIDEKDANAVLANLESSSTLETVYRKDDVTISRFRSDLNAGP
jgi:hypothetical protein